MVKIKRKVQKNLPQLIEWVWDNNRKAKNFKCKEGNEIKHIIYANPTGRLNLDSERYYDKNDLFTVEVEEEIDEDTEFNYLLLTYKKDDDKIETHYYEDKCIKSVLSQSSRLMYVSEQLSVTYFDDKGIPHLIWTHEKGLVE